MNMVNFVKATKARIDLPTPHYFGMIRYWFKCITVSAAALITAANVDAGLMTAMEHFHIITACQYIAAVSVVSVAICSLSVADQTGAEV